MNGTKVDGGDSIYSDHDSNSESGPEPPAAVKEVRNMEVDRIDDDSSKWSKQSNAGSSDESDADGHRDTLNITLESDMSGPGNDPLESLRSPSPSESRQNEVTDRNHSIRLVKIPSRKAGSSRSGSASPIDGKMVSISGYSSSVDVKSPMEVRSHSASPVEVKSGSSSPVDINSDSDDSTDEKEINTIDSDTDDEDCMIVDDAAKAKAREEERLKKERIEAVEVGEVREVFEDDDEMEEDEIKEKEVKKDKDLDTSVEEEPDKPESSGKVETITGDLKEKAEEEDNTPSVRRSLRNTKRKKYQEPDEDDVESDNSDKDKKKKSFKPITPMKIPALKYPSIVSVQGSSNTGLPQIIRFPNAIHRPDTNKTMHNGVSSNVINNMAQRGVSITPAPRITNFGIQQPRKPPPKPKRQPPFPPESIFANMSLDTNIIEAPSFLSPFIFVKKPTDCLKKYVKDIGKKVEEEKRKEEERRLEEEKRLKEERQLKEKLEKEKMEKEMMELADRAKNGEIMEVEGAQPEAASKEEEGKTNGEVKEAPAKKKTGRKRRRDEDNDESWSEGDASESSEEDEDDTVVLKDKPDDEIDLIKVHTVVPKGEIKSDLDPKVQAYFSTPLGSFFIDIGFNLVQERVQSDLLKLQQKKVKATTKGVEVQSLEAAMNLLTSNIERLRRENFPYNFSRVRCQFCSFKTESALVMANHMEVPHTAKNGLFRCNFCPAEFQSPQLILSHVSSEHGVTARLLKPQSAYECPECPFESQTKGRFVKHVEKCSKLQSEVNILKPQEWQPPAKLIKASARPSYNYSYRPRAPVPPMPRSGIFRPVTQSPIPGGQLKVRPSDGFNPLVVGIRPRPIIQTRPMIFPPRPTINITNNLKCGMCGSCYPDATRLREHVLKDHARVVSAIIT